MLFWSERDGYRFRNAQRKYMLLVVRGPGWIAMSPARKDLVFVGVAPVDNTAIGFRVDPGFLAQLAHRGLLERFATLLTTGDGLPVTGIVRALEQQYAQVRGVDENQRRDGDLVRQCMALSRDAGGGERCSGDEHPEGFVPLLPVLGRFGKNILERVP